MSLLGENSRNSYRIDFRDARESSKVRENEDGEKSLFLNLRS
jgi:hypothetical protein